VEDLLHGLFLPEMHIHIQCLEEDNMEKLTVKDLELIKAFMKRSSMVGDDAFEYVGICSKIQTIINEINNPVQEPIKGQEET